MVCAGQWTRESVEELARDNEVSIAMLEPAEVFCRAIVGYDHEDFGLVYEYGLMAEALAESFLDGADESEKAGGYGPDEAYMEAVEFIDCNTMRSMPFMKGARPRVICGGEAYL